MASGSRDVTRRAFDLASAQQRTATRQSPSPAGAQPDRHAHIDGDPFAPTRAWLRKRERSIDFDNKVGHTEIVGSAQGAGFVCKTCSVTLKDSNRYLMHMNSRAHQRRLGVSMRVKRSSREEVKEAFERVWRQIEREKRLKQGRERGELEQGQQLGSTG